YSYAAVSDDLQNLWGVGITPRLSTVIWLGSENGGTKLAKSSAHGARMMRALYAAFLRHLPEEWQDFEFPVPGQIYFDSLSIASQDPRKQAIPFVRVPEKSAS